MSDLPELSYTRPRTVPEAIAALKRRGARAYAGGTDLLVAMAARRPWVGAVSELVDIKNLAAAKGISERGASLRIGALTTTAELAATRTGAALHLGASVAEGLAADGLPPADLELVAVLAERAHRRAVRP